MKNSIQLLKELTSLHGIAMDEERVFHYMKDFFNQYHNEIREDNLGSLFSYKKGNKNSSYTIAVCAHMDEVGFVVSSISPQGAIYFKNIGGIDEKILPSTPVIIKTKKGDKRAIISASSPHFGKKDSLALNLDIGASSLKEVLEAGIALGDTVSFENHFYQDRDIISAKAIDNRLGCAMVLEILETLKNTTFPYDLYLGATVREEIGGDGAMTAARLLKPDLIIGLEVSPIKGPDSDSFYHFGQGPLIRITDKKLIFPKKLIAHAQKIAENNSLPYQNYISPGGTDASVFNPSLLGIPALFFSVPARYLHSPHSLFNIKDYKFTKELILNLLESFSDQKQTEKLLKPF